MKKQLATILMLLPLVGHSQTVNDTTFVYGDKQIVVSNIENGVDITVLTKDSAEYKKTQETTFVDGKEVTKVYVSSPFLPSMWTKKKEHHFRGHIPLTTFGPLVMTGGVLEFDNSSSMHLYNEKSWEWTGNCLNIGIPFNKQQTFGISMGLQAMIARQQFAEDHGLYNDGGIVSVRPIDPLTDGEKVEYSYLSYKGMRFPVYLELQNTVGRSDFFFTFGASLDWRWYERSRVKTNRGKATPTKDININPIGVNLELQWGYGAFAMYLRTALTPMMRTNSAPKAYPMSMGIALIL